MRFRVFDTTDTFLRAFNTWKEAKNFCIVNCRHDWKIVERRPKIYNYENI